MCIPFIRMANMCSISALSSQKCDFPVGLEVCHWREPSREGNIPLPIQPAPNWLPGASYCSGRILHAARLVLSDFGSHSGCREPRYPDILDKNKEDDNRYRPRGCAPILRATHRSPPAVALPLPSRDKHGRAFLLSCAEIIERRRTPKLPAYIWFR